MAKVTSGPYRTMAIGARVTLRRLDSGVETTRSTDGCAVATFPRLAAGAYSLRATLAGRSKEVSDVPVSDDHVDYVGIALEEEPPPPAGAQRGACTLPRYLSGPSPLPPLLNGQYVMACVVVQCVITAKGGVTDCKALEGNGTERMIAELEQRRYAPSLCDGKPADWNYTFRIDFGPVTEEVLR